MREVTIGQTYGCLTVLREYVRDSHGLRRYWCRCSCGHEGVRTVGQLFKLPTRCQKHSQKVAS